MGDESSVSGCSLYSCLDKNIMLLGEVTVAITISSLICFILGIVYLLAREISPNLIPVDIVLKGETDDSGGNESNKLLFFENATYTNFDLEDLLMSSAKRMGRGTFGTTYKAVLDDGSAVVIKRLKYVSTSEGNFEEKIEEVGLMDHGHILPLRAYYFSVDDKLLIYDYMPMGSLYELLHESGRTPLNWTTRCRIGLGTARGLQYLHSRGDSVSHGNIKSSNILLTETYIACVSDFSLASILKPISTPNHGSGYCAPEVIDPQRVSQKADIYSFGILMLELATGKDPIHALLNDEEGVGLLRWVRYVVSEDWSSEVFDLDLFRYQNHEEEMVMFLQVGLSCTVEDPDMRPSISEVVSRIEEVYQSSLQEEQQDQQSNDPDDESPT